jgi:perosamine synthetase
MARPPKSDLPLMAAGEGIVLFYPHVPTKAKEYVCDTLDSRWIGQGPKVEQFEPAFRAKFKLPGPCVGVGSCTDALHLSYLLAGIGAGVEVLTPVFTCAATNIPLLYIGANIRFVDADPKLQFFQPNCLNHLRSAAPTRSVCQATNPALGIAAP